MDTKSELSKIFRLKRNATQADLEAAFRRLALKYHPDKNKGSEEKAQREFAVIVSAYNQLKPTLPPGAQAGGHSSMDPPFERAGAGASSGLSYALSSFMRSRQTEDQVSMKLSLKEALQGTEKKIKLRKKGLFSAKKILTVRVPPGCPDNTLLRLSNAGFSPYAGILPSHVLVRVKLRYPSRFRIEGPDLYLKKAISRRKLRKGGRIKVKTPHGKHKMFVPSGAELNEKIRSPGLGFRDRSHPGTRGDLCVELVPKWSFLSYPLSRSARKARRRKTAQPPEPSLEHFDRFWQFHR